MWWKKILQTKGLAYILRGVDSESEKKDEPYLEVLQDVLKEFVEVYETPQGLPSERDCDHFIL